MAWGSVPSATAGVVSARWEAAMESCRRAAALFPACLYAGVDVLLVARSRRHALLEINAFGDLLPGIVCHGLDTYEAELAALEAEPTVCAT